jgi:CMP-N-acetylneuraminic acid synthetase
MSFLVVIPARGGLKGISCKNLRLLNGKPLLYYSIQTALNSNYNLDVYVSSEDEEIYNKDEINE